MKVYWCVAPPSRKTGYLMTQDLTGAIRVLKSGGVIAYPTEAVWGLGCDPWNETAVNRILAIKRRPAGKGVLLVASCPEQIVPLLEPLDDDLSTRLLAVQLHPLTWLVPDESNWIPAWIKGDFASVAIRISRHPPVVKLCDAFGKLVVSTSANRTGEPPMVTREEVVATFGREVDWIMDGCIGDASAPSSIRDLVTNQVFR